MFSSILKTFKNLKAQCLTPTLLEVFLSLNLTREIIVFE